MLPGVNIYKFYPNRFCSAHCTLKQKVPPWAFLSEWEYCFVTKLCRIQTARALTHKVPGLLNVLDPLVGAQLRRGVPRADLLAPQARVNIFHFVISQTYKCRNDPCFYTIAIDCNGRQATSMKTRFSLMSLNSNVLQVIGPALLISIWATSSRLCPTFLVKVLHWHRWLA